MKKIIIIVVSVIAIIGLAFGGYYLYKTSTPEYALATIIADVESHGMGGLKEHLTSNATEKIEAVEEWTDGLGLSGIFSAITQDSVVSFLNSKISEVDWTVEDILKGENRADVVIGFDYNGSVIGTVEITMLRDDGEWKIDSFGLPHFDELSLW